ncbi:hypothetical protein [Bradyrhizobium cenepequi]|uniref:hypothetical protein n=1 Tax=Bradyrhizobium cenepequi TaxID=2821403 RepID=UPI001CE2FF8C|nr:hypothetical protein [Bradyrhizobium cenepequi]MCA6108571.1 hypothetical protein [Bradyrhizobium cenepequi]
MAFNLFIAYDLDKPGQNYERVHARIKSLGRWYHAQQSLTALSPQQAHKAVWAEMDIGDSLIVVDATGAVMTPALPDHIDAINRVWFEPA